jgi:multidrug efflux pump subunit AcrA (membrane-fusion protein)
VIYNPDGADLVFVVESNRAFSRKIKLGLEFPDVVEVVSGLKDGETVVTLGQYNLQDGLPVEVAR